MDKHSWWGLAGTWQALLTVNMSVNRSVVCDTMVDMSYWVAVQLGKHVNTVARQSCRPLPPPDANCKGIAPHSKHQAAGRLQTPVCKLFDAWFVLLSCTQAAAHHLNWLASEQLQVPGDGAVTEEHHLCGTRNIWGAAMCTEKDAVLVQCYCLPYSHRRLLARATGAALPTLRERQAGTPDTQTRNC